MALTDRPVGAPVAATEFAGEPRGFRPASRRRTRIASGVALAAVAVGGNVLVYSSLDDTTEVLQLEHNIRAGQQIVSDDLRVVEVDIDPNVPVVAADDMGAVVGRYAQVYLPAGTLMSPQVLLDHPVVAAGSAVVSIEVESTRVPSGLLERSQVQLVIVSEGGAEPFVTTGRVVAVRTSTGDVSGVVALSIEVAVGDAARVAAGNDVRVVLLDPGIDPALEPGG